MALPESFLVCPAPFSSQRDLLLFPWTCTYHTFVMSKRRSNIVLTSIRDLVKSTIRSLRYADNASVYVVLKNVRVSFLNGKYLPNKRGSSIQSCRTIFRFQWKLGALLPTDFIDSGNKNRSVPNGK